MDCIVCKESIAEGAKFCTKCSHYQSAWRNKLKFIASIATVITLFVSGVVYVFSQAPNAIKTIYPNKTIELIDFVSAIERSGTIFFNPGDDEIWIGTGEIKTDNFNATLPINTKVLPRSFAVHKVFNITSSKTEAYEVDNSVYIEPERWGVIIRNSRCYGMAYFSRDNLVLKQLQQHYGEKLSQDPGVLTLNFYNASTMEWLKKTVPIVVVLERYPEYCSGK